MWYAVGVALIIAGVFGGPFWLVRNLIPPLSGGASFLAPGNVTFMLDSPGKYVIWHAVETFFEGKWYSSCPELPHGTRITVANIETKDNLVLAPSLGATESLGRATRYSVCSFWVENAGEYVIEINGLPSTRVFFLRKSIAKTVLLVLAQSVAVFLIGGIGGTGLIVYTAIKRNKSKKWLETAKG